MAKLRKLVLDVMKPHEPPVLTYGERIADLDGVYGVNASMVEIDDKVANIKVTLEGEDIDFAETREVIEDLGGSIHSVDMVCCGEEIIKDVDTPQDLS